MNHTQMLVRHKDIQNWVAARRGMPAIARVPDNSTGAIRPRLTLRFGTGNGRSNALPAIDDGVSPVSWNAWLAELDRQRLALRVSDLKGADFEFVDRQDVERSAPSSPQLN